MYAGKFTELPPLPGFYGSSAIDINDAGEVVGTSWSGPRPMQVTLWKNGVPSAPVESEFGTEGLRITNQGNILYRETRQFGQRDFLLAGGVVVDVEPIDPYVSEVIDMNDHGLLLASGIDANYRAYLTLFDINGYRRELPDRDRIASSDILGVDNEGRVALIYQDGPKGPQKLYWLENGGDHWIEHDLTFVSGALPALSKDGIVGGAIPVGPDLARVVLIDLANPEAPKYTLFFEPLFLGPSPYVRDIRKGRIAAFDTNFSLILYDSNINLRFDGIPNEKAVIYAMNIHGVSVGDTARIVGPAKVRTIGFTYTWPRLVQSPAWPPASAHFYFEQYIPWPWPSEIPRPRPIEQWGQLLPQAQRDLLTTQSMGAFESLLIDPELREIYKRTVAELQEKAARLASEKGQ